MGVWIGEGYSPLRISFARDLAVRLQAVEVMQMPITGGLDREAIAPALDTRISELSALDGNVAPSALWHWHITVVAPATADLQYDAHPKPGTDASELRGVIRQLNRSCAAYLDCLETRSVDQMALATARSAYVSAIETALAPVFLHGESESEDDSWSGPSAALRVEWAIRNQAGHKPADFRNIDFRDVPRDVVAAIDSKILVGGDYEGAIFNGIDLLEREFHHRLVRANLQHTHLKGAKFTGADLGFAYFTGSDLRLADFRQARLEEANLRGARLDFADFTNANITNVLWDGAYGRNIKGLPRKLRLKLWWNALRG